jgi:RNA polymerase sigma factor (sigma-70 family)
MWFATSPVDACAIATVRRRKRPEKFAKIAAHCDLCPEADVSADRTTAIVQRCLDDLVGEVPSELAIRSLLEQAAHRLHLLCASLLHRSYPRLTRPPLNLETEEMLGAVVERLLKALRQARPTTVRQFFALAGQHMRWELNDLARRLDEHPRGKPVESSVVPAPDSNDSCLSFNGRRMIAAIEDLPKEEREVFDLVRIQGVAQTEAAELLGISTKTVKRRLDRGLRLLTERLGDLNQSHDARQAGNGESR